MLLYRGGQFVDTQLYLARLRHAAQSRSLVLRPQKSEQSMRQILGTLKVLKSNFDAWQFTFNRPTIPFTFHYLNLRFKRSA